MTKDGERLKAYVEGKRMNKTQLARDLGMSKQNLYQLFDSKEFNPETKKKIEKVLKTPFEAMNITAIPVNIDADLTAITANEDEPQQYGDLESRRTLERTLENMSEDKIRSTAIIERLVALLERSFSSDQPKTVPSGQEKKGTLTDGQPVQEDLGMDKKYSQHGKILKKGK